MLLSAQSSNLGTRACL